MPLAYRAVIFAILGALVVWKLVRAARSGEISSRGYTIRLESSPLLFTLAVILYVAVLGFCLAEIFAGFGLVRNPVQLLKAFFTG